ncbi:unnamed protein product [Prorocentrum cordatum]|uniref:Ankyrin repeat domain-containing protein n=1 Tax=Prorocentrum cordatum TaxID=2364126 RepID=A0ABN9VB40_9DINO|nr:unnamed protein product [Polarella glacialis]
MVELLLREGADPRLLNSRGQTAEQVAQAKGASGPYAAVLEALRPAAAPRSPRADGGVSPRRAPGGAASHREEDATPRASSARAPHKSPALDEAPRARGAATAGGA